MKQLTEFAGVAEISFPMPCYYHASPRVAGLPFVRPCPSVPVLKTDKHGCGCRFMRTGLISEPRLDDARLHDCLYPTATALPNSFGFEIRVYQCSSVSPRGFPHGLYRTQIFTRVLVCRMNQNPAQWKPESHIRLNKFPDDENLPGECQV
jgi:hypothetical protein